MTRWAASIIAISLASIPSLVNAQADCNAVPAGPARTDCYLGLSQIYRAQSDLAAAKARAIMTPRGIGQLPELTPQNISATIKASGAFVALRSILSRIPAGKGKSSIWMRNFCQSADRSPPVTKHSFALRPGEGKIVAGSHQFLNSGVTGSDRFSCYGRYVRARRR